MADTVRMLAQWGQTDEREAEGVSILDAVRMLGTERQLTEKHLC